MAQLPVFQGKFIMMCIIRFYDRWMRKKNKKTF